jgi:rhodanese-related sulfurtransferase
LEFIQQNLILIASAVVSGSMLLFMSIRRPGGAHALTATHAQVVDVREPDEYITGHLPDSRNIPVGRLDERIGELDKLKTTPLILVCQTGARTAGACKKLEKLGFTRVHVLDGGINAWRTAGLPLKKGSKK